MKFDPCDIRGWIEMDDDIIVDRVARLYTPEEVYEGRENKLHEWAIENGYIMEDEDAE